MGQLTSILGNESLNEIDTNDSQSHTPLRNLRRRRTSTVTNSTQRPSRRRRMRFWGSRNTESSSVHEICSPSTPNYGSVHSPPLSISETPIQDALESLSGPSSDLENSSGPGPDEEINHISSDLFSVNTRHDSFRSLHPSSSSSLRSSRIQNSNSLPPSSSGVNTEAANTEAAQPIPGRGNGLNFNRQLEMLSRLVEIAATSTVLSLSNITTSNGRRVDNINRTYALNEGTSSDNSSSNRYDGLGNDSTFGEFIHGLRNGLLDRELPRSISEGLSTNGEGLCFFRAFRFDNPSPLNTTDNIGQDQTFNTSISFLPTGTTSVEASTNLNNSNQQTDSAGSEENNEQRMVPMLIIGIRSVLYNSSDNNPEEDLSTTSLVNLDETENDSTSVSPFTFESSESETTRQPQEDSTNNNNNNNNNTAEQRSWVIFVLGNSFPADSPILSAPSLVSENPTYEDMLHLQELLGEVKQPVTTREELFKHDDQLFEVKVSTDDDEFQVKTKYSLFTGITPTDRCQICLTEYEDNEIVRKLPSCNHFYHKDCVDTWLLNGKNNCPLCRTKGIVDSCEREDQNLI